MNNTICMIPLIQKPKFMRVKNKTKEELVRNDIYAGAPSTFWSRIKNILHKHSMVWVSAVLFELMILMTMLMMVVTMLMMVVTITDSDDENKKARCSGIRCGLLYHGTVDDGKNKRNLTLMWLVVSLHCTGGFLLRQNNSRNNDFKFEGRGRSYWSFGHHME